MKRIKRSNKFNKLIESATPRGAQGDFLRGDYVIIKKGVTKDENFKVLTDPMQAKVKELLKDKTVMRISYIKSGKPGSDNEVVDAPNIPSRCMWADVVIEYAPGMWNCPMVLPLTVFDLVEKETDAEGYAKYSKSLIRPNNKSDKGAKLEDGQTLTNKNVKLANTPKPNDAKFDKAKDA